MGTLYVVATPIGNLEDVTYRAIRILGEVDLIAAEDTRTTRKLLDRYGLKTRLTSFFEHNERPKLESILAALATGDVALVSDAGTPGIADPGAQLVRAAIDAGHRVVPLPGPSAAIAALSAGGLPTDQFTWIGFLPRRPNDRRRVLATLAAEPRTLVFYESPNRLAATLADIATTLGDRAVVVARELTKIYEEFVRGPASDLAARYRAELVRGEVTLLVAGAPPEAAPSPESTAATTAAALAAALATGLTGRAAIAHVVAQTRHPRRDVYAAYLALQRTDPDH